MAQNETQHYSRTLDINKKVVENIDNGILVLNDTLEIHHFNRWLELHTNMKEDAVRGKILNTLFTNINTKTLIRKIKTALRLNSPTFYTASTSKYLIPIKINELTNSSFEYMQQDVSIIPFDSEQNLVALIITDQTNMANTNTLLHSHILKIRELNTELLKERETIDKKVLLLKLDREGKISDVSQALLEQLYYEKDELLNLEYLHQERYNLNNSLKNEILLCMREKKVFEYEEETQTSNGEEIIFKSTLITEYNASGEHLGFILFRENITNSKHLAQTQEKMLATSRSAAMGEMLSMIAHQWRQPLSLINTIMATLKIKTQLNKLDTDTMFNSFEKIESTTKYLSETIDDFSDYFKPNKFASEFLLYELFDKSIFFLKDEMEQQGITYKINIPQNLHIYTYKNELLQSIINIIKNSVDAFHKKETTNKHIKVIVEDLESHLSISIEDNAGGIKPEILKKVFEPYFSTKSNNGTGLGLYMCYTIITDHLKGSINMRSQNATTITLLELPYKLIQGKNHASNLSTLS